MYTDNCTKLEHLSIKCAIEEEADCPTRLSIVRRILQEVRLDTFHLKRVQLLQANHYRQRVEFCQCYLQKTAVNPNFPAYFYFID